MDGITIFIYILYIYILIYICTDTNIPSRGGNPLSMSFPAHLPVAPHRRVAGQSHFGGGDHMLQVVAEEDLGNSQWENRTGRERTKKMEELILNTPAKMDKHG